MAAWLGVDVGGRRKGFDVAVLDGDHVVELLQRQRVTEVVAAVAAHRPSVVAIDSPRSCAPAGATRRDGERELAANLCGIRWTPARDRLDGNPYYEWILEGLALYGSLESIEGLRVIECFPTASWTRWLGPREKRSRSAWSRRGLDDLGLSGVPPRTNQDQRDVIAAAVTARAFDRDEYEAFGDIVVPVP
jgi:predicted nuclease with RNAse H fold